MLDYWCVMCFTGYRLNWNSWIWIPFPIDSDCTFLCTQIDKTRYSSIASGNNCIVQLCKHQGREFIANGALENGAFCTVFSENFHKF
jgi:hypothetical protein